MNSSTTKSVDQQSELHKFRLFYELINDETPARRKRRNRSARP